MKRFLVFAAMIALGGMQAGGALAASPPAGGTISIAPKATDGRSDAALPAFVDAAAEALTARGFTVFDDPDHAASVVELLVSRSEVGTGLAKPGRGGASIIGAGASIPFSTGASELVHIQRTSLEMRIHRRGDTGIAWDGTAVTVRQTSGRDGGDAAVASDLLRALLGAYPSAPKGIIGVP